MLSQRDTMPGLEHADLRGIITRGQRNCSLFCDIAVVLFLCQSNNTTLNAETNDRGREKLYPYAHAHDLAKC